MFLIHVILFLLRSPTILFLLTLLLFVIKVSMSSSLVINGVNVDTETDTAKLRQLVSLTSPLHFNLNIVNLF